MKLSVDLGYILKRIIIGTGIALAIMFIKSNVFAQNCSTTESWIGYWNSNNSWITSQNANSITYNGFAKGVRFSNINTNIQNKSIIYSAKFNVEFNHEIIMDNVPDLVIQITNDSGTNQDITSSCYVSKKKYCESLADGFCYHPYSFDYSIICSAKSTIANARSIAVTARFNDIEAANYTYTTKFDRLLDCLVINPSDKEEIIANDDANTQEILDQNYNYYNRLLETMIDISNLDSEHVSELAEMLQDSMIRYKNQIIANQESNTTDLIDSQKVCTTIDKEKNVITGKYLSNIGGYNEQITYGITDYINIKSSTIKVVLAQNDAAYSCFYNHDKVITGCIKNNTMSVNQYLTIPNNSEFVRFSILNNQNKPQFEICTNGNQGISNILTGNDVNSGILGKSASFFGQDLDTAGNGLVSVITSPITILQRATDTCTSKSFAIFGKTISLPCGTTLFWEKDFSNYDSIFSSGLTGNGLNTARDDFRLFWNIFFGGAIIFHLLVKLFMVVSDALDPDSCTVRSINSAIDTSDVSSYVPKHSYEVTEAKRLDWNSTGGSRSLKNRDIYVSTGGAKYYG